MPQGIVIVSAGRIEPSELGRLVDLLFEDMVKYVVDVDRGVAAVGGELHADAEEALLEHGSRQDDLWGANYYPGRGREECIEYTSLINIRPARDNRGMEIEDPRPRAGPRLTYALDRGRRAAAVTQHAPHAGALGDVSLDQQVLMIANEMNRAGQLFGPGPEPPGGRYERVLDSST